MSVAKFKVVIRLDKLSKTSHEVPVCLRITKDRQTTYKTLLHVAPEYWDAKGQCVKKQHPNAEFLNASIGKKRAEFEQETCLLTLAKEDVSISTIRNKINNRTSFDLFEYTPKYLEELYKAGRYATYKKTKSIVQKLRWYVRKETLPIKHITPDFIKQYEHYLSNDLGNCRNTITVNMKTLAKLVKDIIEHYDLDEANNPFRRMKFKQEETVREALSIEEVKRILDLKFKLQSPLYDAREVFLFECFTGLRVSDILALKWKNVEGDNLKVFMRKTGKYLEIPIKGVAKSILDKRLYILKNNGWQSDAEKYVFNILTVDVDNVSAQDALNAISSATAVINKRLKMIALKAGIHKRLSTHVGRHSFATMLLTNDVNIYVIKELLGHRDVRATQIYTKVVSKKKEEAINVLNNL